MTGGRKRPSAYLRVNGYFILTDLELHVLEDGSDRTETTQVRLVAFGNDGEVAGGTAVHHGRMMQWLNDLLARHHELMEVSRFSDPVLSLLSLAGKVGRPLPAPPGE